MRNIAQIGRRELEAHRRSINGITAEKPRYAVVDSQDHKEWVVDVYVGPLEQDQPNIIRNVPIAPYARNLIGDVRQPVELERSKQGHYTVVGRAKVVPAGTQTPEGSILDASYQEVRANLAQLGLLWTADLDVTRVPWGSRPWGEFPWAEVEISDAFGAVLAGPDVDAEDVPPMLAPAPAQRTKTKHTLIRRIAWGSRPWGSFPWGGHEQTTVELEE